MDLIRMTGPHLGIVARMGGMVRATARTFAHQKYEQKNHSKTAYDKVFHGVMLTGKWCIARHFSLGIECPFDWV